MTSTTRFSSWFGRHRTSRVLLVLMMSLGLLPATAGAQRHGDGATTLTGGLTIAAADLATYSEPFVVLTDASILETETDVIAGGATLPSVPSQIAAGLVDGGNDRYSFSLSLPITPQGEPTSITGADAAADDLPQVFAVDIVSNVAGGPFLTDVDGYNGSPALVSSVDLNANGGATGQLAVWSDGDGAQFPSEVGDDGEALTDDDPLTDLEAGWTIVDISSDTYAFDRDTEVRVGFPGGAFDPNDFSDQGWAEAFTSLVDQLERAYPFRDLKKIDFDALRDTYLPLVERAEKEDDLDAYTLAVYQFSLEFLDGHVSSSLPLDWFKENYGAGFGLTVDRADDGTVYVIGIADRGSADDAGIEVGDTIEEWNGDDIDTALADTPLVFSASSDFARDNQRVDLITRAPAGTTVDVRFTNADGKRDTVSLKSGRDFAGYIEALSPENAADSAAMPIESRILPSGVGYVRINTFATDIVLFTHQWDYAIRAFEDYGVKDIVVDVRANGGGLAMLGFYASATFAEETFTLDTAFIANTDGEFVDSGNEVVPVSDIHWDGGVAVLVDDDCASACEQFAATMDAIKRDDIVIVGNTPSAGVYAAIASWTLPDGLAFQAPFIRYEDHGKIFLEGQGVEPDVDVPVTRDSLLSPEDDVLDAGEDAARGR